MTIIVRHVDKLCFQVSAADHTISVDAGVADGGNGSALSAPQLFAAAVGACMCEFVVNSCRLREIPVESLSLEVTYEELTRPRRIGELQATLHIEPELSEDVKQRLLGVARHATLVNTLNRSHEVKVEFATQAVVQE